MNGLRVRRWFGRVYVTVRPGVGEVRLEGRTFTRPVVIRNPSARAMTVTDCDFQQGCTYL